MSQNFLRKIFVNTNQSSSSSDSEEDITSAQLSNDIFQLPGYNDPSKINFFKPSGILDLPITKATPDYNLEDDNNSNPEVSWPSNEIPG